MDERHHEKSKHGETRTAAIVERLREIAPRIAEFPQIAETDGARLAATLHRCAEDLAAQPLDVSAAVVATATREALQQPATVATQAAGIANSNPDAARDALPLRCIEAEAFLRWLSCGCGLRRQRRIGDARVAAARRTQRFLGGRSAEERAAAGRGQSGNMLRHRAHHRPRH